MWYKPETYHIPWTTLKKMLKSCGIYAEHKPQFFGPNARALVKATQPFEKLNIDFKGPLPPENRNHYMLTIIDEYS